MLEAARIHDECASLNDSDACEGAFQRTTCAKKVAKEMGFDVPDEMF